ncbi:MAG: hypothetical protein HQ507_02430 [Candidatus Marinimicrobia bacterium]|nr:hypothetical protein [Candidatus Neomarinimicrobiota bacterium]
MNTQICIDATTGQDCLEFTSTGTGPSKGWNFVSLQSYLKAKNQINPNSQPGAGVVNQGLFYVNQSAYGQMI